MKATCDWKALGLAAGLLGLSATGALAEPLIYGADLEQLEYRLGDNDSDAIAWEADALVGTDEVKLVLRNEGEYVTTTDKLERLESQVRLQVPITTFFDAVAGLRADTPEGPDRLYGVAGIHGLAPQWFEVDLDFFLSDRPWLRFEADYEALITNYLILTPSLEVDLPLVDDDPVEAAAWGPKVEVGLRLSYDLVDRSVAPYIGFHYERLFGGTKDIRTDEGGDGDAFFAVAGMRLMF